MCFPRYTPPEEVVAQLALVGLVLRGAWASCGLPLHHMARRDAIATAMIAAAFALHRLTLAEYGRGTISEGAAWLRDELSRSWLPTPHSADHCTAALFALVIPAALLLAAAWTATRAADTPLLHERVLRAACRRFVRPRRRPAWLADWIHHPPST
jgi:hypothetical protein